jgi:ferredoxin
MRHQDSKLQGQIVVDDEKCLTCGACVAVCPQNGLFLLDTRLRVESAACTSCQTCVHVCPVGALALVEERS